MKTFAVQKPASFSRVGRTLDQISSLDKPRNQSHSSQRQQTASKKGRILKPSFEAVGRQKHSPFTMFHSKDKTTQLCYNTTDCNFRQFPKVAIPKQVHQRLIEDSPYKHLRSITLRDPKAQDGQNIQSQTLDNIEIGNYRTESKTLDFQLMKNHDYPYNNYIRKKCYQPLPPSEMCGKCLTRRNKQDKVNPQTSRTKQLSNAHDFQSYTSRDLQFHKEARAPAFDLTRANFEMMRKGWTQHANLDFSKFRSQVRTRIDRSDLQWFTKLDYAKKYEAVEGKLHSARMQVVSRRENLVPCKYPFRQSMQMVPREVLMADSKNLH